MTITTSTGTIVSLKPSNDGPQPILAVVLDNPAAPSDMRGVEVGRFVDGGYQPAMFAPWALRPEVLRAIADLIDQEGTPGC